MRITRLTFMQLVLKKIQILCKLKSMINLHFEFHLSEVCIRNHNFSEDAWRNHSDESFHFRIIRVERIGNNIVDFIRGLMLKHQKICVNTDKLISEWALLSLLDYLCPVLFAD